MAQPIVMKRIYEKIIAEHLAQYRQMAFITGPRQSGKTTLSQACAKPSYPQVYLNWDNVQHREIILAGLDRITEPFGTQVLRKHKPIIIFDEIHKYPHWKTLLKGYFDTLNGDCHIIVTGSAKMNVYRHGGDSLMGRYFLYRIHPLSVAEILGRNKTEKAIQPPKKLEQTRWQQLLEFGGFPEPFLQANQRFYQRWSNLRQQQLFQEDLRELSKIHDMSLLELLAQLLRHQITGTVKYSELAKKVRVSEPTIRDWLSVLENVYYSFSIKPWTKNISRSLLKEPKVYLWDWSLIDNPGAKIENLVACHLRKATHYWTDIGLGKYDLYHLRDKDKNEVDFLVTKDEEPWIILEVKSSGKSRLSPSLEHFNKQIKAPHVFQVCADLPYVQQDCFALEKPMIVPLLTFLSQLV